MKGNTLNKLLFLWPFAKKYKRWIIMHAIASIFVAGLSILVSYVVKSLTDTAIAKDMQTFKMFVLIAIVLAVIDALAHFFSILSKEKFDLYILRDVTDKTIDQLQQLPLGYFEKRHSGDIVSRMNNDTGEISALLRNVLGLFYHPFVFIGALTYMIIISPKLLLATVILMPVSAIVFNKISKPIEKKSKQLMEQNAKINELNQDTLNGIHVMKSFNLEDELYEKYEKNVQYAAKKNLEITKLRIILGNIYLILRFIPQLVLPLYGGYLAMKGEITVGELLAANMIIWSVFRPIESFLEILQNIRGGVPAVERIFEIINHPIEKFGDHELEINNNELPLTLENISFSYDEQIEILTDVNLNLQKGKTTALVGASGSGKSTILKLIYGFYKQTKGNLSLYGQEYKNLTLESIRNCLSLVSQEAYLYPKTIKENIGYGKVGATMDEIIEAAKKANAHDFIMKFPKQYDTLIGQEGNLLSGGQRQRISIARAILKDAPILLLDEPTSALDNESEALVQEAISKIMKERTVLVVAHRLSTIKDADEVVVMDKGCIVERGTHESLMEEGSIYKRLYQKQYMNGVDEHV